MTVPDDIPSNVGAILQTENGDILFQLRDNKKDIAFPDHWGLFGGQVNEGEPHYEALVREISEELGYRIRAAELLTDIVYRRAWLENPLCRRIFYLVPIAVEDIPRMRLNEGAGMALMSYTEFTQQDHHVCVDVYGLAFLSNRGIW
jgi:8-oxo-dGTP diphosphatase